MAEVPIGVLITLFTKGSGLGYRAFLNAKAVKQTARQLAKALELAIETSFELPPRDVARLAGAIGRALSETPMDSVDSPGWFRKLMPRSSGRRRNEFAGVTGEPFSKRMEAWLMAASKTARVRELMKAVGLANADLIGVARLFPKAFKGLLAYSESPFDQKLLGELFDADRHRREGEGEQRRFARDFLPAGVAGAVTYGVAEVANWSDPGALGLAVGAGAGLAVLATGKASSRSRVTELRVVARQVTFDWIADLVRRARGRAHAKEPLEDAAAIHAALDALASRGSEVPAPVTRDLVTDLVGRVLSVAREAKDERLVAEIRRVEDALVRADRDGAALPVSALSALLDATAAE